MMNHVALAQLLCGAILPYSGDVVRRHVLGFDLPSFSDLHDPLIGRVGLLEAHSLHGRWG